MEFSILFYLPGVMFVLSSLLIGLVVGGKNIRKILILSRDISIPIGTCGALLEFSMMLSYLNSPDAITAKTAIAMLYLLYGIIQYTILNIFLNRLETIEKQKENFEHDKRSRLAIVVFISAIVALSSSDDHLVGILFHPEAGILVFGCAIICSYIESNHRKNRLQSLSKYSVVITLIVVLMSIILVIGRWSDPSGIGPAIALGLLGLFYGSILLVINNIMYFSSYGESLRSIVKNSTYHLVGSLTFALTIFYVIAVSASNWEIENQLTKLNKSKQQQDSLLRQMAQTPTEGSKENLLTITADSDGWVFIDDVLIRQIPLYNHHLSSGTYKIRIASCPNERDIMYQIENKVTWLEYWQSASDGVCDAASPAINDELIEAGLAKEIILNQSTEEDELITDQVLFMIEYDPEVNFCCDDDLTKEFTITIDHKPQIFSWSFEANDWLVYDDGKGIQEKKSKEK